MEAQCGQNELNGYVILDFLSNIHDLNGRKTPRIIIFNYQYLKKIVFYADICVFFHALLLHKSFS